MPGLVACLSARLDAGEHAVGSALPGEADLAASLGVSRPTLRRALAVLEERGRIERRAGLGTFVSDPAARAVPDPERVHLIGIDATLLSATDDYYRRLLEGIDTGLEALPHRYVILAPAEIEAGSITDIDALVLMGGADIEAAGLGRFAASGRPVLGLNRRPSDPRLAFVAVDYHREAQQATRALLAAGHRRLIYVGGATGSKADRHAGFLAACAAANASAVQIGSRDPLPTFATALRALLTEHGCTALFAEDAATTVRICTALAATGPVIGSEVELLCFDRCEQLVEDFGVLISEIRMPERRMGMIGGAWLRARLSGEDAAPPRQIVPAEVLFRSTRSFTAAEAAS